MNPRNRGVAVFLALTFGAGWAWLLLARLILRLSLVNPLAQLPFALLPAVAAVVVRRWVTHEGFRDAALALRLRQAWPYYLAAWLGPLLLAGAAVGLAAVFGHRPDLGQLAGAAPGLPGWSIPLLLTVLAAVLTPLYWGEEFGWTGYLRLRLLPDRPLLSVLLTGLIWAGWHYPLALLGYLHFAHLAAGLVVWTASILCQECLLAWLRTRSGSIWPAALAHAGNNMVLSLLMNLLLSGRGLDDVALTLFPVPALAVAAYVTTRGLRRSTAAGATA
ncbi:MULTISPECIES: CPBP family intramembrane glutamic endopeptidase [Kitasatospora]|uniref:CAAX prenyl protease 2/Lysostaphin resistance protein A-like domain-containing protein n=1 Tax=Kitasatospora cystarginea TaxID=58350 RepID=A0ABP5Q8J6_9ACTN